MDLSRNCFWVPASVRHDVVQAPSGVARYSFFVDGGDIGGPRGLASNPFYGRDFTDIDSLLTARGFQKVGSDSAAGKGRSLSEEMSLC